MTQKNRIITLIDFSAYSENLAKFSSEFSKLLQAKVIFVHQQPGVVPTMADAESRIQVIASEKNEALEKLRTLTDGYFYHGKDYLVSENGILNMLHELKSNDYFDWVFTGLKGTGLLKKIFMGSTTLKIIDNSDLLTIAFPIKKELFLPTKLVVAVHTKFPLNKAQFSRLLHHLSHQIKEIVFITIITKKDDEGKAAGYLSEVKHAYSAYRPTTHIFKGEHVFTSIKDYMADRSESFLALQQSSRVLTDKLFRKFMINEIVYNGATPLIVLPQ